MLYNLPTPTIKWYHRIQVGFMFDWHLTPSSKETPKQWAFTLELTNKRRHAGRNCLWQAAYVQVLGIGIGAGYVFLAKELSDAS